LLSAEDVLHHEQLSLAKYVASNEEPVLQAAFQESHWGSLQETSSKFKDRISNEHFEAWYENPLHGQFFRDLNDGVDLIQQWS